MKLININLFSIIVIIITGIALSSVITSSLNKAEITSLNATIKNKDFEIGQYSEQVISFVDKQSEIRAYINELITLLYARESYLGVGGSGEQIELNEQTSIFQLKQAINNLNEDSLAMKKVRDYLISRRQFAESFPFIWPVKGGIPRISSGYGVRANEEVGSVLGDRPNGGIHFHAGIDIPGELNDPIVATADGRIVWINQDHEIYGKVVIIQHNYGFQTLYGHCNKLTVKNGQVVKRGDIIGYMGNTGASYGVHLHYEIKKDGFHINPMDLLGLSY